MSLNIQTKLVLLLSGLTSGILLGVLLAVDSTLSDELVDDVFRDFRQTQNNFLEAERLRYDRLVESATLIRENSTFKANVTLGDPSTVYYSVSEFALFAKTDLFVVTDAGGRVLARLSAPEQHGDDLTHRASVARALRGVEPPFEISWPELWDVDGVLYEIVTVPIFTANHVAGTLTLGMQFTDVEARSLKGSTPLDISFFLGQHLVATTLDSARFGAVSAFVSRHQPRTDSVLTALAPSAPFEGRLGNEDVYAFLSPLGQGAPAYFAATVPQAQELAVLHRLRHNILTYGLLSLVATLALALTVGHLFARPILQLVEAMRRVKQGDLTTSVTPTTTDEVGLLAVSFNEMIVGLRERFRLTKYVGHHTLDMIRRAGPDPALGGERRELAVLFSDIRGFSKYSELRPPEEVIAMLNRTLGFQADLVKTHGGSVDKFVGDEMVALFEGDDALARALHCAVAIQQQSQITPTDSDEPMQLGIGVNYGSMVLGNMGAKNRMDYTVVGAAVNLGARLCSAARAGEILIPDALLDAAGPEFNASVVRSMQPKGWSAPLDVATLAFQDTATA